MFGLACPTANWAQSDASLMDESPDKCLELRAVYKHNFWLSGSINL